MAFAAGDGFIITVSQAAASGELAAWDPTASDGSEEPYGILAAEAPINVAAQYVSVYISGKFNADEAVVPEGVDVDSAFDALREKGIYLIHQADTSGTPPLLRNKESYHGCISLTSSPMAYARFRRRLRLRNLLYRSSATATSAGCWK